MTLSAGGSWLMLVGKKDSTKLQQILFLLMVQCCGFIWRHLCFVPGECRFLGKKQTGLALRAGAWLRGCMGTVGPADLKVTLVVVAVGLWQSF